MKCLSRRKGTVEVGVAGRVDRPDVFYRFGCALAPDRLQLALAFRPLWVFVDLTFCLHENYRGGQLKNEVNPSTNQ